MAKLLQRLGRLSATHAPVTIIFWVVALVAAVLFGTFGGGEYSTALTIPGTRSQDLADRLEEELPAAARGTGTMTFVSADGSALDEEQQAEISAALEAGESVEGVYEILDPFQTREMMAAQIAEAEEGAEQLDAAAAELEAAREQTQQGQEQLDAGRAELEAGRAQLDDAFEQIPDVPADNLPPEIAAQVEALNEQRAALDAAEAELDAQQAALDEGRAEIEAGEAEVAEGRAELEAGQRTLAILGDYSVVSEDGTVAIATVTFDDDSLSVTSETKASLQDAISSSLDTVTVYFSQWIDTDVSNIVGPAEVIGLFVAAIVLFVMLRTVITAALPILTALVGVGITVMMSMGIAGFVDMHQISPILGIMLGLAVGIDYTLFVVNRHRQQLRQSFSIDESIGLAVGTSGNAVVFAGLTVITALVALNVIGIPFLGVLGNVAAMAVFIAILLTLTLTPAILHLLGRRVLPRKHRHAEEPEDKGGHLHPVPAPVRLPWLTAALSIVLLGVLAIPFFSMRLGLPDGSNEPRGTDSYESHTITSEAFGPGFNGPHIVAADLPELEEAQREEIILDVGERLFTSDEIVSVLPAGVSDSGDLAVFQLIGASGPSDVETEELVELIRGMSPMEIDGYSIPIEVTGQTAMQIDVSENLGDALPVYLSLIIAISFVLLVIVFRSILVPLAATAGFLFSVLAAMGAVVAIYQWGWLGSVFGVHNPGPILSFLPTIMVGILFGLAMDYQLFLTTGMREAWVHGRPARAAVVDGLYAARSVVIAAALIMFSVFAGFIFSELSMVRPIGFGLAIGVVLDAFVVRMALIPALLALLGEKSWWIPRWLDKILPSVDVEGSSLERPAVTEEGPDVRSRGKHARLDVDVH
ncbi:MMPL family transporter [Flaviflexus huanghaiensis]|uniref:MMPL family transporter n=1 Tax=Flaviflexus huanghaiensis TaxID=1111473 RepID=UPI0015F799BF|nr:MMPL family transporter [Flaviflexus huanghaiensis]